MSLSFIKWIGDVQTARASTAVISGDHLFAGICASPRVRAARTRA
jgi:hypothetical protein